MKLVLASESPRRRELLTEAGYEFVVSPVKVSEIFDENMNPREVAAYLAEVKSRAWVEAHKPSESNEILLLTADTTVVVNDGRGDQILNKPKDVVQAADFLRLLSNRTHSVISGLCLYDVAQDLRWVGTGTTEVSFRFLTALDIASYVSTGEPLDKAGAYGLQGAARDFVTKREGSWSNVVGLPLELLEDALTKHNWSVDRRTP